jgi:hypothetical protein
MSTIRSNQFLGYSLVAGGAGLLLFLLLDEFVFGFGLSHMPSLFFLGVVAGCLMSSGASMMKKKESGSLSKDAAE